MSNVDAKLYGMNLFGQVDKPAAPGPLVERFTVPPFSVLDKRAGYWQDRKRAWLGLGIKSELGRGEDLQPMAAKDLGQGLNNYRRGKREEENGGGQGTPHPRRRDGEEQRLSV